MTETRVCVFQTGNTFRVELRINGATVTTLNNVPPGNFTISGGGYTAQGNTANNSIVVFTEDATKRTRSRNLRVDVQPFCT